MKILEKVDHAVLTLKISPAGSGMSKVEVDGLVNRRLGEGFNELEIFPVKNNLAERGDIVDLVQLYVFKRYVEDESEPEAASRKVGRPKKQVEEPVPA